MPNVTIAANVKALNKVLADLGTKINSLPPITKSGSVGPFSATFEIGFFVSNLAGAVSLTSNGVTFTNLEITYNPLKLTIAIALPAIQVGGECIIPDFTGGCLVRLPTITIIPPNTTIDIPIDLSGIFAGSFSGEFSIAPSKQVLMAKGALTTHEAHTTQDTTDEILHNFENIISSQVPFLPSSLVKSIANIFVPSVKGNLADKWLFHLKDIWSDLQIIDVGDTTVNILDKITSWILSELDIPSAVSGVVEAILQPFFNLIGQALDIGNDITVWLSNLFQTSFGLMNVLETFVGNVVFAMWPVFKVEDPYPIIDDTNTSGLIAVLVPIEKFSVAISAPQEVVISANIL
jgi:hypothetical protein